MANQTLDLTDVINVTITTTPSGLQIGNINTCALISSESPSGWAGGQKYAIYTNAAQVSADFGANSSAYAIAVAFFAQTPNPLGTNGYLAIIPRSLNGASTVLAAVQASINAVYYFGILVDSEYDSDTATFGALASYVQTINKVLFYASSNITDLVSGILATVQSSGQTQTRCMYYGNALLNGASVQQTQIFAGAYAGRALTVDFGGSRTDFTMNLKQLTNITPDQTLTQTAFANAAVTGVDIYPSFGNFAGIVSNGNNAFWDQVYSRFWLKFALQVAGFNALALTATKIPQTEEGMGALKDAYRGVCVQGLSNGYMAPGTWTSSLTFGPGTDLVRNITDAGYYIYSLPVSQQAASARAARQAPLVQIAVKEAGALHTSNVNVVVNP